MRLRVDYPELSATEGIAGLHDIVEAEEIGGNVAEIKTHATYMPLAPGDVVSHHDGVITGVVQWALIWLIEVDFKLPANLTFMQALPPDDKSNVKIDATAESWRRDAWVSERSGYTFLVSAPDRDWIKDRVASSPYVEHIELVRYPDMALDFEIARRNACMETLADGPWS